MSLVTTEQAVSYTKINEIQDQNTGVKGKLSWPIRIISLIIYICVLVINYTEGVNRISKVSNNYHLYVTPSGMFFLIWPVIYLTITISLLHNIYFNIWSPKAHMYFAISNCSNLIWVIVFDLDNDLGIYFSTALLFVSIWSLLMTWIQLGKAKFKPEWMGYAVRNTIAFYLGWTIAATNISIGILIVYVWGNSKNAQLIVFWIMAPTCAVVATAFNGIKYGKIGLQNCLCLWLSVIWAFIGAGIASSNCMNGNNDDSLC